MIKLDGSTHLSYTFPADLHTSFLYYSDIRRSLAFLPHISILDQYSDQEFRMLYATTESGVYNVRMVCDIQVMLNEAEGVLRIQPLDSIPPVESSVTLHSMTAQGFYRSQSIFTPGDKSFTEIDYRLELSASLPVPFAARIMPSSVLNSIAHNITNWRIHEIAHGFIQRSVQDYANRNRTEM
jgi:hypothetical protein